MSRRVGTARCRLHRSRDRRRPRRSCDGNQDVSGDKDEQTDVRGVFGGGWCVQFRARTSGSNVEHPTQVVVSCNRPLTSGSHVLHFTYSRYKKLERPSAKACFCISRGADSFFKCVWSRSNRHCYCSVSLTTQNAKSLMRSSRGVRTSTCKSQTDNSFVTPCCHLPF